VAVDVTTVYAGGRPVAEGFFARSGFAEVSARIEALSEQSLDTQLWILGRGLSQSIHSRFQSELVRLDANPQAPGASSSPVELLALALCALDQLLREGARVAREEIAQRPVRDVLLIEGDDRGPALIGAAHARDM
jgi:hypothetical protein